MMKPEAIIHVRFLSPDEGGRKTPIKSDRYGCPLMVNDQGFDCRFVIEEFTSYEFNVDYDIPVKFLDPSVALTHLDEGVEVSLWEGKTIAVGKVVEILG